MYFEPGGAGGWRIKILFLFYFNGGPKPESSHIDQSWRNQRDRKILKYLVQRQRQEECDSERDGKRDIETDKRPRQ